MSAASSGDELRDRGRASVAQPLEPRHHVAASRRGRARRRSGGPSVVRSRIGTRISSRNRCGPLISTPVRASSSAGSKSVRHGSRAVRARAPLRGRPRARARRPTLRRRGRPGSRRRRNRSRPRPSTPAAARARRRSSRAASARSAGSRRSRNPPPAGPRQRPFGDEPANAAATTASTALPPLASAHAPASAVCGFPAATAPRMGRA